MLNSIRNFAPIDRYDIGGIVLTMLVTVILLGMAVFHISLFFVGVSIVSLIMAYMITMARVVDLMSYYVAYKMDTAAFEHHPDSRQAKYFSETSTLMWELEARRAGPIVTRTLKWLVTDQEETNG